MNRLECFTAEVYILDSIAMMPNLEYLTLYTYWDHSREQSLAVSNKQKNTSVKYLKLIFSTEDNDLEFCQGIVNHFSGLIHLDLM